jgi:hypothetical protein
MKCPARLHGLEKQALELDSEIRRLKEWMYDTES